MHTKFAAVLALAAVLATIGCRGTAGPPVAAKPHPVTILIGETWLGAWADGHLVRRADAPGWQFNAARFSADGRSIEVAAYPIAGGETASVLRFDADSLALLASAPAPSAAQWPPLPAPVGVDDAGDAAGSTIAGERRMVSNAAATLVAVVDGAGGAMVTRRLAQGVAGTGGDPGAGHRLPSGEWHAALSPDGSTAAAFHRAGGADADVWRGQAWDTATGAMMTTPHFFVDGGAARESGAARSLACLLPYGQGAVFTFVGAPADRSSEFVAFGPGAGVPVPIKTPYVMTCLSRPVPASPSHSPKPHSQEMTPA